MRIAFILPTFTAGGAERVASLLCNYWVELGHDVTALTFEGAGDDRVYPLDDRVTLRGIDALNRNRSLASRVGTNLRRLVRLRAALKAFEPDAIVAFTTEANLVAIWSALGLGVPVVVSERNQPDRPGLGHLTRAVRRLSYPLAAALVVQTEGIAQGVRARFGAPVHVLPNPIRLASWGGEPRGEQAMKRIVAVGRLVPQKGFAALITSFAALADDYPDWQLVIYGEGTDRAALESAARRLSLGDRIVLPGVSKDMRAAFAAADLFVLPSRYEGYPNVLLEALASSCAAIATDCPGGTAEILGGGKYGVLVEPENPAALTTELERMMSNQALRRQFAAQAREAVSALDVGAVGRRWLELFASLAG
jgi:glycosyltransferase involved in cell wall biosynthesis